MRVRPWTVAVAAPLALAGVLVVEAYGVATAEYLPNDPGYRVDATVGATRGIPLKLAVLGDSTAAGVGSPTAEEALPTLIAERVARQLERPVEVIGYGVAGARTDDIAAEQLPLVTGADVIVIVIGSNDVTHVTAPWRFDDQTRDMLEAARATGASVVLAGIPLFDVVSFPQPLRWAVARMSSVHRRIQARIAGELEDVVYVNIARDASPRFVGVEGAMSSDGFHPGPPGYGFWADAIADGVVTAAGR